MRGIRRPPPAAEPAAQLGAESPLQQPPMPFIARERLGLAAIVTGLAAVLAATQWQLGLMAAVVVLLGLASGALVLIRKRRSQESVLALPIIGGVLAAIAIGAILYNHFVFYVVMTEDERNLVKLGRIIEDSPGLSCIADMPPPSDPLYELRIDRCMKLIDQESG